MSTQPQDPQLITLTNVRLSYPELFTPKPPEEGKEPQFSASFILDKVKHADLIKRIEAAADRTALDFFKKKVPLKHRGLRDGNEKSDKEGYGDEVMFLSARAGAKDRPVVVDANRTPLTATDSRPYAGCYVNAVVRIYAYEHKTGGKGVSFALKAVQFARDGESFGASRVDPNDVFEDVSKTEFNADDF